MSESIVAAAVRMPDGEVHHLLPPARHHNVLYFFDAGRAVHDQGFLTNTGRYVDREEALKIAQAAGQMKPRLPGQYDGPELFSEDLW